MPIYPSAEVEIECKAIEFTRDLAAASGDVAYAGFGFTPTMVIVRCFAAVAEDIYSDCTGFPTLNYFGCYRAVGNPLVFCNYLAVLATNLGVDQQLAILKSYDADGLTITWTKVGNPVGTARVIIIAMR